MADLQAAEAEIAGAFVEIEDDELSHSQIDMPSFVKERSELLNLVDAMLSSTTAFSEDNAMRIKAILEKYQEQSSLLDPHLPKLVGSLMAAIRQFIISGATVVSEPRILHTFKTVYLVCKVRGSKIVSRLFPHEVIDLERTFEFLCAQNKLHHATWEVRYVVLLWLSIIALIPFNLDTVDSKAIMLGVRLQDRLLEVAKSYLSDSGLTSAAACALLATLLSRPDYDSYLDDFCRWSAAVLSDSVSDVYLTASVYNTLVGIFSRATRETMLRRIPLLIGAALNPAKLSTLNRKLSLKLVQRIALTLLKQRNPKWKYQRRSVSLLRNLGAQHQQPAAQSTAAQEELEDDDEEYDIPDDIEEVIEALHNALGDKDTIVRWSAAKGLGRVTGRLPLALADDVVESLIGIFNPRESDASWHGACLAVAELARRGLLLPSRLPSILPKVIEALNYEQKRGTHTIGSHVRDAACYVCWALARAYEPQVLQQVLTQGSKHSLATALLVTSIFDKEINCRRAAAAAFQEHVGRSGRVGRVDTSNPDSQTSETFPYGLEIISIANFFTLSNRMDAYTKIAPQAATFPQYRRALIDHLVAHKVGHVDISLRELTAKALNRLVAVDPAYFVDTVLPRLLPSAVHLSDVYLRQGALLAIAEIVSGLGELVTDGKTLDDVIPVLLQHKIREIEPEIDRNRLYRGKGAEWIRIAVCRLIQAIAQSGFSLDKQAVESAPSAVPKKPVGIRTTIPVKTKTLIQSYLDTLEEDLKHPQESVQTAGVDAFRAFWSLYLKKESTEAAIKLIDRFRQLATKDPGHAVRRGYTLALGTLPRAIVEANLPILQSCLESLLLCAKIPTNPEMRDLETRRNAIAALSELIARFGFGPGENCFDSNNSTQIFKCLMLGLEDYSTDNRGDVGSWVRSAAIKALELFTQQMSQLQRLTEAQSLHIVQALMKQSTEKIDQMRELSGSTLQRILQLEHLHVPYQSQLVSNINNTQACLDWSSSRTCLPLLASWMSFDEYAHPILAGFVRSVGGKNNSRELLEDSIAAVTGFIKSIKSDQQRLSRFGFSLVRLFDSSPGSRITDLLASAVYRTVEIILATDAFYDLDESTEFPSLLSTRLEKEAKALENNKSVERLSCFANLLAFVAPFSHLATRQFALFALLLMLSNQFPVVRKAAAEALQTLFSAYSNVAPSASSCENIQATLNSLRWESAEADAVEAARKRLYAELDIPMPQIITTLQPLPEAKPDSPPGLSEPLIASPAPSTTDADQSPPIINQETPIEESVEF